MPGKYPAPASSIVGKSLVPHLEKKIRGKSQSTSYKELIHDSSIPLNSFIGIAGEPLEAGKFGHFQNGTIIYADFGDKVANCYIITPAEEGGEVKYVVDDYIVTPTIPIDKNPYLSTSGDVQTALPTSGMIQIVGERIDDFSFLLKIKDPLYW